MLTHQMSVVSFRETAAGTGLLTLRLTRTHWTSGGALTPAPCRDVLRCASSSDQSVTRRPWRETNVGDFFPRVALFPETEDLVRHPRDRFALTDFPIAAVLLGDRAEPSLIASTVVTVRAIAMTPRTTPRLRLLTRPRRTH